MKELKEYIDEALAPVRAMVLAGPRSGMTPEETEKALAGTGWKVTGRSKFRVPETAKDSIMKAHADRPYFPPLSDWTYDKDYARTDVCGADTDALRKAFGMKDGVYVSTDPDGDMKVILGDLYDPTGTSGTDIIDGNIVIAPQGGDVPD